MNCILLISLASSVSSFAFPFQSLVPYMEDGEDEILKPTTFDKRDSIGQNRLGNNLHLKKFKESMPAVKGQKYMINTKLHF